MIVKLIFALLVMGFLITPALADSDNSKKNSENPGKGEGKNKNLDKIEKTNSNKESNNGFKAFGEDFNSALSNFGKMGKNFYEMDIGELIYGEIVSLDKKINNIDNSQIRRDLAHQTQRAMDVILGEGSFDERISGVNSILSDLADSIENKTSDNEIDPELGQELLDDANKLVDSNLQQVTKTLIMPKTNSVKSNFDIKWHSITLPAYEADMIAKKLKDRGFSMTSTLFENEEGKTVQALRLTPPAFGKVKPDEIKISDNKTCKEDFVPIFKTSNGTPACVKPDTAEKLMARGWAISF